MGMITLEVLRSGSRPTDTEVARYVGEMAAELANMARGLGANELAAMLELAKSEAQRVIQGRGEPGARTAERGH
jgi:plasmid maintenance system antidote protein VapI